LPSNTPIGLDTGSLSGYIILFIYVIIKLPSNKSLGSTYMIMVGYSAKFRDWQIVLRAMNFE